MNFYRKLQHLKLDLYEAYKYDEKSEVDREMLMQVARTINDLGSICYKQCHSNGLQQYNEKCTKKCAHEYINGVDSILKNKQSQRN